MQKYAFGWWPDFRAGAGATRCLVAPMLDGSGRLVARIAEREVSEFAVKRYGAAASGSFPLRVKSAW